MSGQSNDCLRICNVKMKKNFYRSGNGAHLRECRGYRAVASADLKIFSWDLGYQYQLDLDGAHGYIHGPCTTACIWANTAWIFLQPIQTRSR